MIRDSAGRADERDIPPKLIAVGVVVLIALIFVLQNTGTATVNFLWIDIDAPGWIWFLVLFLAGVVVGSIVPWFRRKKRVGQ